MYKINRNKQLSEVDVKKTSTKTLVCHQMSTKILKKAIKKSSLHVATVKKLILV